jgi:hypothetical protein
MNLIDPATVPDIVKARIFNAAELQATRRRIAHSLGTWYVLDERREPGRQRRRDEAAHLARHWRDVAADAGFRPPAVRRAVLETVWAADGSPLGRFALEPATR